MSEEDKTEIKRPINEIVDRAPHFVEPSEINSGVTKAIEGLDMMIDPQRVISYPRDQTPLANAHLEIINGLTSTDLYFINRNNPKDSIYYGITNVSGPTQDGTARVIVFAYPKGANMDIQRARTDVLLKNANNLLKTVGAKQLLPEIPKI